MDKKVYTKEDFDWTERSPLVLIYPPEAAWMPNYKLDKNFWDTMKGYKQKDGVKREGGLWTHVPFCKLRCNFCWFPISTNRAQTFVKDYMDILKEDIIRRSKMPSASNLLIKEWATYGGTPTILPKKELIEYIETVHKYYKFADNSVKIFWTTPDSVIDDRENFEVLKDFGIKYIRMGVQSFDPELTKIMVRSHSIDQAKRAICILKDAGFDINIDLLYGLPGQDMKSWESEFDVISELEPHEVTLFQIGLLKASIPWYKQTKTGKKIDLPNRQTKLEFLKRGEQLLNDLDYHRAHIVSWRKRKPGEPKPNIFDSPVGLYYYNVGINWNVIGIGPMALSFVDGCCGFGHLTVKEYMKAAPNMEVPMLAGWTDEPGDDMRRYVIQHLHALHLNKKDFQERFGVSLEEVFPEQIDKLTQLKLLMYEDDFIKLSTLGKIYIANICNEFFSERAKKELYNTSKWELDKLGEDAEIISTLF